MKNITVFLSENFLFFEVKFSIYLNRRVFVMSRLEQISVVPKMFELLKFDCMEIQNVYRRGHT